LASLSDVFGDTLETLYIADLSNNKIRLLTASTGIIDVVAGGGTAGNLIIW